jgi:hypothetical protein
MGVLAVLFNPQRDAKSRLSTGRSVWGADTSYGIEGMVTTFINTLIQNPSSILSNPSPPLYPTKEAKTYGAHRIKT